MQVDAPTATTSGAVERCQKADKAFPRVTAHALRHTAASLAIASGESESGATDAWARLGRDDAGRLRRFVRLGLHCSCRQVI